MDLSVYADCVGNHVGNAIVNMVVNIRCISIGITLLSDKLHMGWLFLSLRRTADRIWACRLMMPHLVVWQQHDVGVWHISLNITQAFSVSLHVALKEEHIPEWQQRSIRCSRVIWDFIWWLAPLSPPLTDLPGYFIADTQRCVLSVLYDEYEHNCFCISLFWK